VRCQITCALAVSCSINYVSNLTVLFGCNDLQLQGGPKSKPLPSYKKIVLNRIIACR